MYSKRELTVKQMIVREVIQLLSIELIILIFTFGINGLRIENLTLIIAEMVSIAVVFVLVIVIRFFFDKRSAKIMTSDLKEFQRSFSAKESRD
jgi:phosphoglycerol transferase MdoB-like AlkP superfamily enzyme